MKSCFGTIYPDSSRVELNTELQGKVFRLRIDSLGLTHGRPILTADMDQWADCQKCEDYHSCYDFSNAKLAMNQVMLQF